MPLGIPKFFKRMGVTELAPDTRRRCGSFQKPGLERFRSRLIENWWPKSKPHLAKLNQPLIQCQDLEHTYHNDGVKALDGVSMEIFKGDMVAIVGQNGSGKTTLAKHFNGLLMPTGGEDSGQREPTRRPGCFQTGAESRLRFPEPGSPDFLRNGF